MTVGPNFEDSFADSHMAINAHNTVIKIGRYEIKLCKTYVGFL